MEVILERDKCLEENINIVNFRRNKNIISVQTKLFKLMKINSKHIIKKRSLTQKYVIDSLDTPYSRIL